MLKTLSLFLVTSSVVLAVLSTTTKASALGPVDIEVAAKVGFGTNPTGYAPNPLGFEAGGRAGISFFGFYGGVTGSYNLGGTTQGAGTMSGVVGPQTLRSYQLGVELGYGFKIPFIRLVIRPQVGIGNYTYTPSGSGQCDPTAPCISSSFVYVEPGILAMFTFGHLIAGVDVNAFILPAVTADTGTVTDVAFTAHAQIGVRF
jgi:hypothetical protein